MSNASQNLPIDIFYTREHVWVRMEGKEAVVGITDFAQDALGEIVFVDLPLPGTHFKAGREFGTVESVKAANALYMPFSGTVRFVNEELSDTPTLVNMEPYGAGWMLRIDPHEGEDAKNLLDAQRYAELIQS